LIQIIKAIAANPRISAKDLSSKIGISSAVDRAILAPSQEGESERRPDHSQSPR